MRNRDRTSTTVYTVQLVEISVQLSRPFTKKWKNGKTQSGMHQNEKMLNIRIEYNYCVLISSFKSGSSNQISESELMNNDSFKFGLYPTSLKFKGKYKYLI